MVEDQIIPLVLSPEVPGSSVGCWFYRRFLVIQGVAILQKIAGSTESSWFYRGFLVHQEVPGSSEGCWFSWWLIGDPEPGSLELPSVVPGTLKFLLKSFI